MVARGWEPNPPAGESMQCIWGQVTDNPPHRPQRFLLHTRGGKKEGETSKSDDTSDGYCKPGGFGDFMPVGSVRCPSEIKTERYQVPSSIRCRVPIRYRCGGRKYLLRGLPVFDISRRYHGTKVLGIILRKCSSVLWQWYVTLHALR